MKRILLAIIALAWLAAAHALEVETTPGQLQSLVTDKGAASLTVKGSIDARDFHFIATNLLELTTLNIAGATIEAYDSAEPLFASELHYPAMAVPPMAFFGSKLAAVTLPAGLREIGMGAFAGCEKLTNITLPAGLTGIGAFAFSASGLKTVTVPAAVTTIGKGAFARCASLTTVTLTPAGSLQAGEAVFLDCEKLATVTLGENVTELADREFAGCTSLKALSFTGQNNISRIGDEAFAGAAITNFNFGQAAALQAVGDWAFTSSAQVAATLPQATKHVGEGAFYYARSLKSFSPGAALDTIAPYLLAGTAVTNGTLIGAAAKEIGDYALYNTPATAVTVPATVQHMGTMAMAGMTQLQEVTTHAVTPPALGDDVWAGVNQSAIPLKVPIAAYNSYLEALQWQNFMVTKQFLRGDVNQDGAVNAADVTALYNLILGISDRFTETGDVNGDGSINAADVTAVYNIIMGMSPANAPARAPRKVITNDNMNGASFTIAPGESHTMGITLSNNAGYCALQLDAELPQGLAITAVKGTGRTAGMTLGFNQLADGTWRILLFKSGNETMPGSEGEILNITFAADDSFSGNNLIAFSDVIAVEPDETVHEIRDFSVEVSTVTGVTDITAANRAAPVDVYNTSGQLLRRNVLPAEATQGLPQGIYIVGGKKVLVK